MSGRDALVKRLFDVVLAAVLLLVTWWLIAIAVIAASIDTRRFGLFTQTRVGKDGAAIHPLQGAHDAGDRRIRHRGDHP